MKFIRLSSSRFAHLGMIGAMWLLLSVIFVLAGATGTTYEYPRQSPVLTITFPTGWKESAAEGDYIEQQSPLEEAFVALWALPTGVSIDDATKKVSDEIAQWVTAIKVTESGPDEVMGLAAHSVSGTGKYKTTGEPVEWEVTFFSPQGQPLFAVLSYTDPDLDAELAQQVEAILDSISLKK